MQIAPAKVENYRKNICAKKQLDRQTGKCAISVGAERLQIAIKEKPVDFAGTLC